MAKRFMLVDGNSLTYRAFHALPPDLRTSSGQTTNAVLGFTNMLVYLVKDHKPDHVIVAWDRPEPTFRHEQLPQYKANRSATPDELLSQFPLLKQVLESLSIPQVELAGFEADDLLATLSHTVADGDDEALIVTGDRDSFQLVADPHIRVIYNKRGVTDYETYDEDMILQKTGVAPSDYVFYAALRGDNSDNLKGVPGVGEKTAAKLVNKYRTVDALFAALGEQTPKLAENLKSSESTVRSNLEVMLLRRDVPLDIQLDDLSELASYDQAVVTKLFDDLEFKRVLPRVTEAFGGKLEATALHPPHLVPVDISECDLTKWLDSAPGVVGLSFDEVSFWLCDDSNDSLLLKGRAGDLTAPSQQLSEFLEKAPLAVGDAKALYKRTEASAVAPNVVFDASLAAYLLDPNRSRGQSIADLMWTYNDTEMASVDSQPQQRLDLGTDDSSLMGPPIDAWALPQLAASMGKRLNEIGAHTLLTEMEIPLAKVLAEMELAGVLVDVELLDGLRVEMESEVAGLAGQIFDVVGHQFNINSTKALQEVLFSELGLPPQKKTKTGYSTNQATLEALVPEHKIAELLLRYREVEKLRSTYTQALLDAVGDDGRIHATFRQTVARTGRLSSDSPNLHNIPIRSDLGKRFREVFVAPDQCRLLVADYNQIELRCIAHLADDPGLIEAFSESQDVHTWVASQTFGVSPDEVTSDLRGRAKAVSYGLAYGMEAFGLAQRLGISNHEATEILDSYFAAFPAIKQFTRQAVKDAKELGYTETLFGRRRWLPDLEASHAPLRAQAERQAMNAGIQGLAADIFKLALIRVHECLARYESRLILQVHDEVIVEVPNAEIDEITGVVVAAMTEVADLKVPLEVDFGVGLTWADTK